ncbi:MAG: RluA family pseudouridine synthase [Gammaproteobacteria bacterium]|nr:RluA family pseudouridine synthase [Gammaproteobacteria bacterium]
MASTDQVQLVSITERHDGQRLDNFLIRELKGVPRSRIYRLIRKGEVRVNKKRCKPDTKLSLGDNIRIPPVSNVREISSKSITPGLSELLTNSILLESDIMMVLNKPAGLSVHGGSGVRLGLIEAMRQIKKEWSHLELAHRLDRDTSGCLVIAKTSKFLKLIQGEFQKNAVDKTYLALVHGEWPQNLLAIDVPLKKNQLNSGERVVKVNTDGKSSKTLFKCLERFRGASLLEANPVTGRTHQIRVHCQYAGHPIIGDLKYGPKGSENMFKRVSKLCLHAARIRFPDPVTHGTLEVEAPLDKYFQGVINEFYNN